jgi:hypothetical protein
VTKGRRKVGNADQAHQNSEYVRRLLKKKYPGFAAVLERVVWELTCVPAWDERARYVPCPPEIGAG